MTPQLMSDNSTVFSIVPTPINEFKPGIYPGWFKLVACLDDSKPERLLIDRPSQHAMHIGGKKDPVMIPTATYVLAKAVVDDYMATQIWTTPNAKPGLTWIQGNVSVEEFKTKYKEEYERIKNSQKNWFYNVVKQTDIYWVQTKKNIKVVSDIARYAAKFLGLDKEWIKDDTVSMEFVNCPACMAKVDPRLAICNVCFKAIINKRAHDDLKLQGLLVSA
jgi:hypothetical protein